MKSWNDYWKTFDLLIEKLSENGSEKIINELKEAQKLVNSMTDGWFEFKEELERILNLNKTKLTVDQIEIGNKLVETLNNMLAQ